VRAVWSPTARTDFELVQDDLKSNSDARAAQVLLHRGLDVIRRLPQAPLLWKARPQRGAGVRRARIGAYLVIYAVEPSRLVILRIAHSARNNDVLMRGGGAEKTGR
jgi:plasmid stabilization system protein ParE